MIHLLEVPRKRAGVKSNPRQVPAWVIVVIGFLTLSGCEGRTSVLVPGRFGQVGHIQVDVVSRLDGGSGLLRESLRWRSDGAWVLAERVSYRGIQGSETLRRSRLNPGELAQEYSELIRQLNEAPGLRLLGGVVSEDLTPTCDPDLGELPTLVQVTIHDELRDETRRWVRCAEGALLHPQNAIAPGEAGPDAQAARVITAAQLALFFTLGEQAEGTYTSTIAYGTLAQGEHSPALPTASRAFVSGDGQAPPEFRAFWSAHAGETAALPDVDWETEAVFLAAVGVREEAGDVVRVGRVLGLGSFTRVELVEQVPGNFCSPAAMRIHPFHLVVLPAVPIPVEFTVPRVERIPCGA